MKLSIIVPVYNASNCIEALYSSLSQIKIDEKELIFVDDCSQDNSRALIEALAERDPSVHLHVHENNCGAGIARNTGFATASGDYCLFFDADDLINTQAVKEIVDLLDTTSADLAIATYELTKEADGSNGRIGKRDRGIFDRILQGEDHKLTKLAACADLLTFTNYPWNKIIRTSYARKINLWYSATKVQNDVHAHWQSLLFSSSLLVCDKVLAKHIVPANGSNITNISCEKRLESFKALQDVEDLFSREPDLRARYYRDFVCFKIMLFNFINTKLNRNYFQQFIEKVNESIYLSNFQEFVALREKYPEIANDIYSILANPYGFYKV
ncbi:glycosyltransferase family 2 protein [uncultured Cohaesibacter sp.]|uniref:glycosyltransferase family 2 protein n=1 Tax=uncultured Cohaesibacter sp. TaxID=1002546 RepID=UPI0029C8D1DF|nr:glycosyltransferase family 2 protein [uncultured Cohaesibacter sp.]